MKEPLRKSVPGTTLALTSLAVLGAAAVVSAPLWFYYRRKRKRTDSLANTPPAGAQAPAPSGEPGPTPQAATE
jgi:hypothetical protein